MFAPAPLPTIGEIQRRLEIIFPGKVSDLEYLASEATAKTVFVMLYIDAIEGNDIWLAPKHVIRMTQEQSYKQDDADRQKYQVDCLKKGFRSNGTRWYQENSRETIRDECIRKGLYPKGCILLRRSIPTTSSKPRYALYEHFARLFTSVVSG